MNPGRADGRKQILLVIYRSIRRDTGTRIATNEVAKTIGKRQRLLFSRLARVGILRPVSGSWRWYFDVLTHGSGSASGEQG